MDTRWFTKIVFEDEENGIKFEKTSLNGLPFELSTGAEGELVIRAQNSVGLPTCETDETGIPNWYKFGNKQ